MTTEQMLSVIAIVRAFATADHVGIEALIKDAPATGYGDLLAFIVMYIEYTTGAPATSYLDEMANGVLAQHIADVARTN